MTWRCIWFLTDTDIAIFFPLIYKSNVFTSGKKSLLNIILPSEKSFFFFSLLTGDWQSTYFIPDYCVLFLQENKLVFDQQLANILAVGFKVTLQFYTNSTIKKNIMKQFLNANPELSPICEHVGDTNLFFFLIKNP